MASPIRKADIRVGSPEAAELRARIGSEVERVGLDRWGVADPIAGRPDPAILDDYLETGRHAGMGYLARHREARLDPRHFFPGVRSILSVALSYYVAAPEKPGRLRISRYARGADYHRVLRQKLRAIARSLRAWVPGIQSRIAVDTAPVLERHWAEQAGIGWIGRHGCLIVPGLGSWVFLGEVFIDVPLPPGTAPERRCGTCRRCLEACPTGALVAPGLLDARRCVAYWTVEHRGAFPTETPPLSPWLFGCDRCQEVCPWNRHPAPTREEAFLPVWEGAPRDPAGWEGLTEDVFARRVAPTPLERAGREGLARNARRLREEQAEP